MGQSNDLLLTEQGHWSGARIKYTIKLAKYLKPDGLLEKTEKMFSKKTRAMSENQWNKIMDAKGQTGQKYFNYLVEQQIMIPTGKGSNGNRHYDVYRCNIKRFAEEIQESSISEQFFEASKFIVNHSVPNRKVRRDY